MYRHQQQVKEVLGEIRLGDQEPKGLYEPIQYTMDLGGKGVRPLFSLLAYRIYKPEGELEQIAPIMRAVELFHNFTLLHDDVMDDAPTRRGYPSVYKKWGTNTAILSGDAMMIEAYRELEELPSELLKRILPIFNKMALGICEGQQHDIDFESTPLAEMKLEQYLSMIRLKTAYLFQGAVVMGAIAGGAPESDLEQLRKATELVGLAFQIQDDYLDVFGKEDFGKQRGGDILEQKKTWLLLVAYSKLGEEIESALALEDDCEKIELVTQLYQDSMTDERALREIERLTNEARKALGNLVAPKEATAPLLDLFDHLVGRSK
ncbi:MAG: polyprenyl synthetase family protein [Porphyromonas sp.]|nr:polyprenyl synthetase family protein [Porphyromonas sp.]